MFGNTLIVLLFVILITAYLMTSRIDKWESWIIFISLLVLIYTLLKPKTSVEGFANDSLAIKSEVITLNDILMNNKKVDIEENINEIAAGLLLYTTAFNSKSYPNFGKSWINLAGSTPKNDSCNTAPKNMDFELSPIFSRKTGFYLGNNRLIGPYSNGLGIQFHGTFTFIMVVKHGNLLVNQTNSEIEILKLYANSPNNNGMAMYIKNNTLINENDVQLGKLLFQYADTAPRECVMNANDTLMHLDKDILTFYYIVKDIDHIRILYMNEKTNTINVLLKFNISNDDTTFSNKESVINRLLTWNANIFVTALYNRALTDDDVTSFYNHVMNEYMKNNDASFMNIVRKYNDTIDFLTDFTKCPLDKNACNSCASITSWCDPAQISLAPQECKKSIDTFCSTNPKDPFCKCWDKNSSYYNTDSCKLYRSIFGSKDNYLNYLSIDDLDYIKKKYKLLTLDECPKDLKVPEMQTNKYQDYDYNKLKIDTAEEYIRTTPQCKASPQQDENRDPNLDKITIKKPVIPENVINDLYVKDPNVESAVSQKTIAESKLKDIQDMARREQNSYLRIGQGVRTDDEQDMLPQQDIATVKEDSKPFGVGSDRSDSFFNKFIKVMMPSSY